MRVLKPGFLNAFAGKIINLHPSLLPSFPGLDGIGQDGFTAVTAAFHLSRAKSQALAKRHFTGQLGQGLPLDQTREGPGLDSDGGQLCGILRRPVTGI